MSSKTFQVPNIGCDGCVRSIKNELGELAGVTNVEATADTKTVTVNWEAPASWEQIVSTLIEIEYPPAEA